MKIASNNSTVDMPLELLLTFRIQSLFWQMLDKDFKRKVDNESIHDIFELVFNQLTTKQLINILNQIEPNGVSRLMDDLKEWDRK